MLRLQPLSPLWTEIPQIEREALLEFELRKHQFLYKGMKFVINYNGKDMQFSVLETKPQDAIMITDTDLQTDIAPSPVVLLKFHTFHLDQIFSPHNDSHPHFSAIFIFISKLILRRELK